VHKFLLVLLAAILMYINPVLAREGGGHNHGHHGASGSEHGSAGATAAEHMSKRGLENANAQWSSGATTGQDRSELRKQGHGKQDAGTGYGEHQGKAKHHDHQEHGHDGHDKGKKTKEEGHKAHKDKGGKGSNR
jgi:hypothetical protein